MNGWQSNADCYKNMLFCLSSSMELWRKLADTTANSGKSNGRGLYVYLNTEYYTNQVTIGTYCPPDLVYVIPRYRRFYFLREFSVLIYILTQANAKLAQTYMDFHYISCWALVVRFFPTSCKTSPGDQTRLANTKILQIPTKHCLPQPQIVTGGHYFCCLHVHLRNKSVPDLE